MAVWAVHGRLGRPWAVRPSLAVSAAGYCFRPTFLGGSQKGHFENRRNRLENKSVLVAVLAVHDQKNVGSGRFGRGATHIRKKLLIGRSWPFWPSMAVWAVHGRFGRPWQI